MADNQMLQDNDIIHKSQESEYVSYVKFVNRSKRNVDLLWIDYEGNKMRYASLAPGSEYQLDTFETHPWVFRDSETYDIMVVNKKDTIYFPTRTEPDEEHLVTIGTPVWSLKEICMQQVRKRLHLMDIKQEDMPQDLLRDICAIEDTYHETYEDYESL